MKNNKSYLLIAAVLAFLFALPPKQMLAQENLVDRLNKALNLKLPDNYDAEARKFIEEPKYKKLLQDKDVIDYTEKFFVEQMKEDWGINKQDLYLFLLSSCFEKCTGDYLYYAADGNDKRLDDYTTVMDKMNQCGDVYGEGLKAYLQQLSAEAKRRSAEADKEAVRLDLIGLKQLVDYYNEYIKIEIEKRSDSIIQSTLKETIEYAKRTISRCKIHNVDYKAILLKELGDEQKVKKILKFYEIE